MADDGFFTATTTWQAVELSAVDITNGTFSVFNLGAKRIGFIKKAGAAPTVENGVAFMEQTQDTLKYTLLATEKLFCKTVIGTAKFGVIPA